MKADAHVWVVEYRGSETDADAEWNITHDCYRSERAAQQAMETEQAAEKRVTFRIQKYIRVATPPPCGSEGT